MLLAVWWTDAPFTRCVVGHCCIPGIDLIFQKQIYEEIILILHTEICWIPSSSAPLNNLVEGRTQVVYRTMSSYVRITTSTRKRCWPRTLFDRVKMTSDVSM